MSPVPIPSDDAKPTILVTGGTGYIGAWIVSDLLDRGFLVRAVARSENSAKSLKEYFPKHTAALSTVVVSAFDKEGAFDDLWDGVSGVAHVASPITWETATFDELVHGAVNSSLNLLKSVHRFGKSVSRVVITSSTGALGNAQGTNPLVTDKCWNDTAVARASDPASHPDYNRFDNYLASKTLAEKACFDYVKKNDVHFDIVTVLPCYTFGPIIHHVPSLDKLGSSPGIFVRSIKPSVISSSELDSDKIVATVVDVRDIATLHSLALTSANERISGMRLITGGQTFSWNRVYTILQSPTSSLTSAQSALLAKPSTSPAETPEPSPHHHKPGQGRYESSLDTSNVKAVFPEWEWKNFENTVVDSAKQALEKGWIA